MTSKPPVLLVDGVAIGPPPASMPADTRKLLASVLDVSIPTIDSLWNELQYEVWKTPAGETRATNEEVAQYTMHGATFLIGVLAINVS